MPRYPGFIGGSNPLQSLIADCERTVNLYTENAQGAGTKSQQYLLPTPGFNYFSGTAQGITDVVGKAIASVIIAGSERVFAVIGAGLYEVFMDGTVIKRGVVAQDGNPATINYNGAPGGQLWITAGGNGYSYVLATNTLALQLTGEATMGAFAHGYCLAFNRNNGHVRFSALNDATTWDALDFFTRSLLADPWQGMFVDGNSLVWLPGTETYEVWYNTTDPVNPFAPLSGLVGPYGMAAPFAFGVAGSAIAWLTRNAQGAGLIASFRGGSTVISTYGVAAAIEGYQRTSRITDAEVMLYESGGHTNFVASFPSALATWMSDIDKPSWSECGKWNAMRGDYDLWTPRVQCYAFGQHLIGDRNSGTIATMDSTFSTELDGTGIRRLRRAAGLTNELSRQPYDRLELLMDVGLGTNAGQGQDPQIMLRISRDGGRTWGNERIAGMGRMGEYRRRVYWNRLGSCRDLVVEVTVSDPVPVRIVDAYLNNSAVGRAA